MAALKRLALLSCRSPFLDDSKVYCPLANLYLKAYLCEHAPLTEVVIKDDIYDLEDLSWVDDFDAIGLSIMTPQRHEAFRVARAIRSRWPSKTLIAGGPHVKHYGDRMESESCFDYLVPFDGERALTRIVTGAANSRRVCDVLTRQEIATQPRPDRTSDNAVAIIRQYRYQLAGRDATTLMTARGCPEQCSFCEDALTTVRWSSLANITSELLDIKALGYGGVYIFDDLFAIAMPCIRPICEVLSRLDFVYRCNAQARYFTKWKDEMAQLLASTGCHEIAFGAESGSQRILDNVRKRCTVAQNYDTVRFAKRHGLRVKAFILLGLPGEDWQTLGETEAFVRDSGIDDFQCAVYMPFRGTRIREDLDKGGTMDLQMLMRDPDGDVSGAYGIKGGETAYEVRTAALSDRDLRRFRDYLVQTYRPRSHRLCWDTGDQFFDQARRTGD